MGDMADYFIALALDAGEGFTSRRRARAYHPRARERNAAKCNICGSTDVHWRLFEGDYKLADNQRQHPGNRYVQHHCPTSAAGFEDEPDA